MQCPHCGVDVPTGANFCPGCGTRQAARAAETGGEQRQLTVMFIDLVGSTAMSERLDPERLEEVLRSYQMRVTGIIDDSGGTVAQYLGDGMLVYFGYPAAHEDAAGRALHAGVEVLSSLDSINAPIERETGERLQLRIGVHTGDVVVTLAPELGAGKERLAIGMTMNVASRLSDAAPPDGIAVSDVTRRLASEHFEFESMGGLMLKGVSEPMITYRVVRELAPEEILASRGKATLVGRDAELRFLYERFHLASRSSLQTVVVVGEPGVGKTQLIRGFRDRIREQDPLWLEVRCSHFHRASALYPLRSLVSQGLDLGSVEAPEEKLDRMEQALAQLPDEHEHTHALLAALLSLPSPAGRTLPRFSPERMRSEAIEAIGRLMMGLAAERTVVLVLEDLHWVDPSTLEVLDHLHESAANSRILLLLSHRTDDAPAWERPPGAQTLLVERLQREDLTELIDLHTGGLVLPQEIFESIISRADGIPLFAEELTKMVIESELLEIGTGDHPTKRAAAPMPIPTTLQDSLMARLDRLALGMGAAQTAATIGRTFSEELLCDVSDAQPADVRTGIQQLLDSDLVREVNEGPLSQYMFRHALIQDTAYGSLLRRDRTKLHAKVAESLERKHPEIAATEPELLAHHYAEGERFVQAVALLQQAGRLALRKSAAAEAVHHFSRGIEALMQLPESESRDQTELALRLALGNTYITTEGYASEPVEQEFERATELCSRAANTVQLLSATSGLWGYHLVKGQARATESLVVRLQELSATSGDVSHLLMGFHADGVTNFYQGKFGTALPLLEHGTELYEKIHEARSAKGGGRPWRAAAVTCPMYLGWCLHLLGHTDRGIDRELRALEQAEQRGEVLGHVEAMTHVVAVLHDRREPQRVLELSNEIVAKCEEYGLRFWLGVGLSARGWSRCLLGEADAGIEEMKEGLNHYLSTGSMVPLVYRSSYLAEAYLLAGRTNEGLRLAEDALARSRDNLDRFYDAEMMRLRGALKRQARATNEEVESIFRDAADLAAQQGARMLELRATVSWLDALAGSDREGEVRRRLERLYTEFSEGFELADLQEARAALEA